MPGGRQSSVAGGGLRTRVSALDLGRGVAVIAMILYHFAWDLSNAGLIGVDVGIDPAWRVFAHLIAGSFLAMVGVSLVLSAQGGLKVEPFLLRLAFIVAGAAAVSLATWFIFPDAFVFFGILHAIAVASVVALPFLRLPAVAALLAAAACFVLPSILAGPAFNAPWLWWLGLSTDSPASVDFVPVFPWLGATLLGVAAAQLALQARPLGYWARAEFRQPLGRGLIFLGRWSLVVYLAHQPILFGIATLAARVLPASADRLAAFQANCERSCRDTGAAAPVCANYCGCVADRLVEQGLAAHALANDFTPPERERWQMILAACRPAVFATPPTPG